MLDSSTDNVLNVRLRPIRNETKLELNKIQTSQFDKFLEGGSDFDVVSPL